MPASHQIIRCTRFGGPEVLQLVQVPIPAVPPGHVLVRVARAAVNFSDVMRRRASPYPFPTELPFTPGSEVSGTVAALGEGVSGPPVGTPVFALAGAGGEGGYAQHVVCDAGRVVPVPPGLDLGVAATVLVAGATAVLLVEDAARVQAGDRVVVPAAAGGVGSLVVQLARQAGAFVVAGASTVDNRERATALGAHAVFDDADPHWPDAVRQATDGHGADVLLSMAGGDALVAGLSCLAPFGRAVVYGAASGRPHALPQPAVQAWLSSPALGQSIQAFNLGLYFGLRPQPAQQAVGRVIGAVLQGTLVVSAATVMPLASAAEAHARLEARTSSGKILLDPWS